MITVMRTRLTASLATIAVTSATLMCAGAGTASAQDSSEFHPDHLVPSHLAAQVEGAFSKMRAALPPEVWAAFGSREMVYQGVPGAMPEGIVREVDATRPSRGLDAPAGNAELDREAHAWADRLAAQDRVYPNQALLNRGHGQNIVAAGVHGGAVCLV